MLMSETNLVIFCYSFIIDAQKLNFARFIAMLIKFFVFMSLCISISIAFECGVRKVAPRLRRITNGEKSYAGQWPWLVTLHKKVLVGPDEFFCGATLINEFAVVTGMW